MFIDELISVKAIQMQSYPLRLSAGEQYLPVYKFWRLFVKVWSIWILAIWTEAANDDKQFFNTPIQS